MKTFSNLGLSDEIVSILHDLEITTPTEIQARAIPLVLRGEDVVGLSQTGTGKTYAFALPIIQNTTQEPYVQSIVLCPTRELAEQILLEVRKVTSNLEGVRAIAVYGGADMQRQIYSLKRGAHIVIGTPGRVLDHIKRRTLKLGLVEHVVLDEADEMLNMGFRDDIEEILRNTPKDRQTVMFSATMSKDIMAITNRFMRKPITIQVGSPNTTIASVKQSYFVCPKDKKKRTLYALLTQLPRGRTIIFCNTKKMVDSVQLYLQKMGFMALALHGDMPQPIRKRVMNEYKAELNNLLVTTDIAARGIDVKDIMHVINFDLPQNNEYYIHRVGRTGRAGKSGNAYTLLNNPEQVKEILEIEKKTHSKITASTLTLDENAGVVKREANKPRGKKLNIKSREKRAIISGKTTGSRYNDKISINGSSKLGKKRKTLRNTHHPKKQNSSAVSKN